MIVIDDINGLSNSKEFVDWYKRCANTMSVEEYYEMSLYFLLAGYLDKFDNLVSLKKSFGRLFHYAHVDELSTHEIKDFYKETFNSINIHIDEDALNYITYDTAGVPLTMQYIGDSLFWILESENVVERDVKEAIISAYYEIRSKQLRILNKISKNIYEEILIKIAGNEVTSFSKQDLKKILTEKEMDYFDDFIEEMLNMNILRKNDVNDYYNFVDKLDYSYYLIKSFEKQYIVFYLKIISLRIRLPNLHSK